MNNKPYGWHCFIGKGKEEQDFLFINGKGASKPDASWDKVIPLYTHPVKEEHFEDEPQAEELHEIMQSNAELTDEKIDECSCFVDVELSQRYGSIESIDDIDWTITGLRAFARAILLKAQEK